MKWKVLKDKGNIVAGLTRFHPPEVKEGIQKLELARDQLVKCCAAAWVDFMSEFAAHYATCRAAVQALAALDVLQVMQEIN